MNESKSIPEKEYIVFCDESVRAGRFYSNFYGGVLVGASQYEKVTQQLNAKKAELNFFGEVKWEKVTERYLEKYEALMTCFFEELASGNVKIRLMFRQNANTPKGLTIGQTETEYFNLYYQFIKHSFGLIYSEPVEGGTNLRLYFDEFPETKERAEQFKGFVLGLASNQQFEAVGIKLIKENITEVRSHDHVLLQCLDIVLGAMAFRLNDKHKEKPEGQHRRGKRTIAKEKLYKSILAEICKIYPHFNPGVTTGCTEIKERWTHPYRHWSFVPKEVDYKAHLTKRGGRK
jgi:hypothetical protein